MKKIYKLALTTIKEMTSLALKLSAGVFSVRAREGSFPLWSARG